MNSLPKTLKKLKFKAEAVPDMPSKPAADTLQDSCRSKRQDYAVSENITRWIERFGICADILDAAKKRESELIEELYKTDNELVDILHIIEIEKPKDLYKGWLLYKKIKRNRENRRILKDELLIIGNAVEEIDPKHLHRQNVEKAVNGLFKRKYRFRVIEEEDNNAVQTL